jgi:hypothetical protein
VPTAVLENRRRERCRFIADSPGELALLVAALQRHDVPMKSVRSTFLDVYLNRRWPA